MPQIQVIPPTARQSETLRVAAYCRVSSASDDQLHSFANQMEHYQGLIRSKVNWELVDLYADEGLTGTRADKRPEFQRLMRDCRKGRVDKIVTKSISRFSRNTLDCLTSIRELKMLGVEVFFEKEGISSSAMAGEMMLSIYGMLAQEESVSISGNMRWSIQKRMERGEFLGTRAPYGFELEQGNLYINQAEAPIVRRIFQEYLAGGSIYEIARRLDQEGIPKTGGRWTWKSVLLILQNEKCGGNALLQKRYTQSTLPFRQVCNHGERDMYYIENSNPPIVPAETFDLAQALMKRRCTDDRRASQVYLFSGRIRCGHCGCNFKRKLSRGKVYWRCARHNADRTLCPTPGLPELLLRQAFVRMWRKLRANYKDILLPMIAQLTDLQSKKMMGSKRICDIEIQIAELSGHNQTMAQLRAKGYMDTTMYMEQTNQNNAQITLLRQERTRLLTADEDETLEQSRHLLELVLDGPEHLAEFDSDLFRSIVSRMTVCAFDKLEFTLINGLCLTETLPDTRRYRR